MSKDKPALAPEKISIESFKILKGAIESPFGFDPKHVEAFSFDMGYDVGVNPEESKVLSEIEFSIETKMKGESEETASGFFRLAFVFWVENLAELISVQKKKITHIDLNLEIAIASISYSTSRGILMTRFKGTALEDFILPVIDPVELLEPDDDED